MTQVPGTGGCSNADTPTSAQGHHGTPSSCAGDGAGARGAEMLTGRPMFAV
jgi:hypothetical protein